MSWRQWIRTVEIVPAVSRARPGALEGQAEALLRAGCRIFHVHAGNELDGLPAVRLLAQLVRRYDGVVSVQLAGPTGPGELAALAEAGAGSVTVQLGAAAEIAATLDSARALGLAAGVAYSDPAEAEAAASAGAELVRCPGNGLHEQLRSIRLLSRLLGPETAIEVGGAVSHENARELYEAGARVLLVGAAIFEREDLPRAYRRLLQALA